MRRPMPMTEAEMSEIIKSLKDLTPDELKEMLEKGKVPVRCRQKFDPQTSPDTTNTLGGESDNEWICLDG